MKTTDCFILVLLITVFVMSSGDILAQVNWTKYPGNPILSGGPSGSWNMQLFLPFVLYNADSSRYEMWFSASDKSSGPYLLRPWKIGYAVSNDGISWNIYPTPVLNPSPGKWDSQTVEEPFVIRESGLYKMWYSGGSNATPQAIGYATSPDGINWAKDTLHNPILTAGNSPWENGGVCGCFLIPDEGGYKIWYTGFNVAGTQESIGYATSVDGIVWQRDIQNNPALSPGIPGEWDDTWLGVPRILFKDNIYYMWYLGVNSIWGTFQVGLATSSDGINWQKHQANPVLQPSPGQWDETNVECGNVIPIGDTLYMYFDGGGFNPAVKPYKIGLATSPYISLPLPAGNYTIGSGGNFATIQDAFNKLETDGVAGNVTLELIDDLYTAPTDSFGFKLNGPILGVGPTSRVILKPAENKNVTIEGSGGATLSFLNTKYVTIDGISITGPTTLTIRSLIETQFTWVNTMVFFAPAANNIVENVTFNNENYLKGVGLAFMSFVNTTSPLDSNLIQNNFIKKASIGIYISGWSGIAEARYNIVRGNIIGSENDSLITWGIQIEGNDNSTIEDNRIENVKQQFNLNIITHGINVCGGNSCIVRNNVVHKVRSHILYGSTGILLSGDGTFGYGINNLVYNNMVYDIQSTSTNANSRVAGIQLWYQSNPKIYYNSVNLSGTGGANPGGSAALFIVSAGTVTNLDVKNNILVNTRDESPYCASTICDYSSATFTSDFNDLFYEPNQYNCLVRIGGNDYHTLADWQTTGKDINSIIEMPNFIAPYLHTDPNIPTDIESHATPISGIDTDYDEDLRHVAGPDIGADEFEGEMITNTFQLSVDIIDGWNMVSIPGLHPVNQNVLTWWLGKDPSAEVFKYGSAGYVVTNFATPGEGYWMKHTGARTYNTGEEWPAGGIQFVMHNPITAQVGWNLIGGYEQSVLTSILITNPAGLITGPVYKYSNGYQIATTLDPGYGYWIKLTGPGQIIIPNALEKESGEIVYFQEDWGRLILTDATGIIYTLYAIKGEADLSQYELPPAPIAGMFDIRYSSGRIAEDLNSEIKTIDMSGVTYPLTVRVEGMDIRLMDETGKTINVNLKDGEDIVISDATINKLMVSGEMIPAQYALEQNYPNPFNPETVIEFSLPEDVANVKLSIYNALGEKVAELVNTSLQAGRYQYQWNASSVATGMYVYELRTDKFISVKKMILMK